MSRERLHELWTKHLAEGVLLPEEEQELLAALRSDPAFAEQLTGDVEIDGLLRSLPGSTEDAEASARRFLDCVAAEDDTDRFVGQVVTRISAPEPRRITHRATRRKSPAPTSFPWRDLAVAAGVLIAIGVLYALLRPSPAEPPRRPIDIVRPPEPRETPAPRTEEPPAVVPEVPKPAPAPALPEPSPAPAPAPPTPREAPAVPVKPADKVEPPPPRTVTTVASLDRVDGDVVLVSPEGRGAAKAGDGIPAGCAIETAAAKSSAVLKFGDGTRLELAADTLVREIGLRRVMVARGTVSADVVKQPADQPLVFATPHGEARVLGTSLRLDVGKVDWDEVAELVVGSYRLIAPKRLLALVKRR